MNIHECPDCAGTKKDDLYFEAVNIPICDICKLKMEQKTVMESMVKPASKGHDYLTCSFCNSSKVDRLMSFCEWYCFDCNSVTSVRDTRDKPKHVILNYGLDWNKMEKE
jgi:ribosomal protein L37AE/L43A